MPVPVDGPVGIRGKDDRGIPATAIEPALTIREEPPMPETTPASPDPTPAPVVRNGNLSAGWR
ncbi:MAG: hypothetical protein O9325_18200 [Roseomonas sp.]|nr:hypothetical protein [Roseomonas sp.]